MCFLCRLHTCQVHYVSGGDFLPKLFISDRISSWQYVNNAIGYARGIQESDYDFLANSRNFQVL